MTEYTTQIQRSFDGTTWTAVTEPELLEDVDDITHALECIADDLAPELPSGLQWRVAAWCGTPAGEPDEINGPYHAGDQALADMSAEQLLVELDRTRLQRAALDERRNAIIAMLMPRDAKIRAKVDAVVAAAGVGQARLYQIRDQVLRREDTPVGEQARQERDAWLEEFGKGVRSQRRA